MIAAHDGRWSRLGGRAVVRGESLVVIGRIASRGTPCKCLIGRSER